MKYTVDYSIVTVGADAGVDAFVLRPPGDSIDRTVEALHRYAETFLKE